MRLLVDGTPLRAGGGVQAALALLEGLLRSDIEWMAVVSEQVAEAAPARLVGEARNHGRLVVLRKRGLVDQLRAGVSLRRIERAFRPDVVFTVFGPAYFRARAVHVVGFALGLLLYDVPGADRSIAAKARDLVRKRLFRRYDRLVVETPTVADRVSDRLGIDRARISVVGNAANPLLAAPTGNPDPGSAILIPASFYPHKNLEIIPDVAAALAGLRPARDWEIRLTLDAASPGWQLLSARAAALGVADRLVALGTLTLDQLSDAYQRARIVLLPTLCESSTAVYPEAFHFRRPLVTSRLDFALDLCGDAARFVDPHDPSVIALALAELIEHPDEARLMVERGAERLKSHYPSPEAKFAAQRALLSSLAEGRAPA